MHSGDKKRKRVDDASSDEEKIDFSIYEEKMKQAGLNYSNLLSAIRENPPHAPKLYEAFILLAKLDSRCSDHALFDSNDLLRQYSPLLIGNPDHALDLAKIIRKLDAFKCLSQKISTLLSEYVSYSSLILAELSKLSIINEVNILNIFTNCHKENFTAFLMGTHPVTGCSSTIFKVFENPKTKSPIADPCILKIIDSLLSPS